MKKIIITALLAAFCFSAVKAGPYEFGVSLFEEGDYYRAIGEFKRYIFENPKGTKVFDAGYKAALSYYYAGRFDEAAAAFEKMAISTSGIQAQLCRLQAARAFQDKKDYRYSGAVFRQAAAEEGGLLGDEAVYLLAWNHFYEQNFEEGEKLMESLKGGKLKEAAEEALKASAERSGMEQKSGLLAGLLGAVLPGAGHLYCGKVVEGLSTMLITSLLAYNVYEGYRLGDEPKIWLYGIPAVTFYGSSIYGAVNAADRFNEAAGRSFTERLTAVKIDVLDISF